ncbi:MAG: hypothetical protein H6828_05740 [Planctomycetes bacterium]|nr:hypothetical protein [Planctomycetota bacterium]
MLSTALLALPLAAGPLACLWDYDTLEQERARFPSALELLTGRFPRHSDAYYRWRIADRQARRAAGEVSPELYDDLAVALSKLGEHDEALALLDEKDARWPGLYETLANRGTFLIHAGRLAEGADVVARAIEVNPDAHFGREVYQELLVRYVLERQGEADAPPSPLEPRHRHPWFQDEVPNFWTFVRDRRGVAEGQEAAEVERAVKGVLGMMRFGHHDSPILCEALADLLLAEWDVDAKRLAARALLLASQRVEDPAARAAYRERAEDALSEQTPNPRAHRSMTLEELEPKLRAELAEAEAWWAELAANEARWIEAGEDVDARFHETYYAPAGTQAAPASPPAAGHAWRTGGVVALAAGALALGLFLAKSRG